MRAITDILWAGSSRVRAWRGGDVRAVYYSVLGAVVVWGIVALRLAQPIVLLQLGANVAGLVFIVASLHLLYVNTRLLPQHVRPPMWRRAALVADGALLRVLRHPLGPQPVGKLIKHPIDFFRPKRDRCDQGLETDAPRHR